MQFDGKIVKIVKWYIDDFSDDAYTCTLPKDSGSCDNKIFRYYYNAIEVSQELKKSWVVVCHVFSWSLHPYHYFQRRCKLFVYGGCKGNGNNFVSEVQCLQKCGDESDLALLPQVEITTEIGKKKGSDAGLVKLVFRQVYNLACTLQLDCRDKPTKSEQSEQSEHHHNLGNEDDCTVFENDSKISHFSFRLSKTCQINYFLAFLNNFYPLRM